MKSYVLSIVGSGATSEIYADSDRAAIRQAKDLLGTCTVADQWDADGANDEGYACKRILFWACDEDGESDPGANAIASLSTTGSAR